MNVRSIYLNFGKYELGLFGLKQLKRTLYSEYIHALFFLFVPISHRLQYVQQTKFNNNSNFSENKFEEVLISKVAKLSVCNG